MRERPILFNDAMVRAILAGRKTQTRRPVKGVDPSSEAVLADGRVFERLVRASDGATTTLLPSISCPFGVPGDVLYVREAWGPWRRTSIEYDEWEPITRPAGGSWKREFEENGTPSIEYRATSESLGPWQPSILMPRSISRLSLRVTDVRVERVRDITEEDARAEGFDDIRTSTLAVGALDVFEAAWDGLYATGSFLDKDRGPLSCDANPWVWAVTFEVVR